MTMNTASRIPLPLQAVFLASNRGKEVNKPPPEKLASKTFSRSWMFQGLKTGTKRKAKGQERLQRVVQFGNKQHPQPQDTAASKPASPKASSMKAVSSTPSPKNQKPNRPPMSPQAYLDVMIHARGYSTRRYRTLQTGYYSKPTAFQQASYHVNLVKLVRNHDVEGFRKILESGISPNPCNSFGESLLHMVCRRWDTDLLQIMLDVGSTVQVADDYGRTPLHDACWAAEPSFETVELVANRDITLFHMTDSRGAVPLSYVRREHWHQWIEFLESKKDTWWPPITGEDRPSVLVDVAPNEKPIAEPKNALSTELAGMVVSGVMSPQEVRMLQDEGDTVDNTEFDSSEFDLSDNEDEYDSDDDSDDDSESSYDSDDDSDEESLDAEEELAEELGINASEMSDILKRVNYANSQQRVQPQY